MLKSMNCESFINANLSITNKRQYKIKIDINDKLQYFHKIKFPFFEFFLIESM